MVGAVSTTMVRSVGLASVETLPRDGGGAVTGSRPQKAHSDSRSGSGRRHVAQRGRDRWPRAIQASATAVTTASATPTHHPRRNPVAGAAVGAMAVRAAAGRGAASRGGADARPAGLSGADFSTATSGTPGPAAIREASNPAVPDPGGK